MYLNEGLYTTLTWSQLAIGLVFGLAPVVLTILMKQALYRRAIPEHEAPRHRSTHWGDGEKASAARPRTNAPVKVAAVLQVAYYTLGALADSERPMFFGSLVRRIHAAQKADNDRNLLTVISIRATLERLIAHGDVRLGDHGLAITSRGTKLYSCIARIYERPDRRAEATPRRNAPEMAADRPSRSIRPASARMITSKSMSPVRTRTTRTNQPLNAAPSPQQERPTAHQP